MKIKIKSMRKEKEMASLRRRLEDYRSQILLRLTLILSDQQSSTKIQLDRLEHTGTDLSNENAKRMKESRVDLLKAVEQLDTKKDVSKENPDDTPSLNMSLSGVRSSLGQLSSMAVTMSKENKILQSLFSPSMYLREETIDEAEEGTFEWIFEDKAFDDSFKDIEIEARMKSRNLFINWLRTGSGVFHISGKAGSGKSTLIKFLCDHKRTEEELEVWAGEKKKLAMARLFFWRSNDDMQMSLTGLYRSILFEVLKRCPELIPSIFQTEWEQLGYSDTYVGGDFLRQSTILKAFKTLTEKGNFPKHRFCFFIDGLDEYQGDSLEHLKLVKSLLD